MKTAKMKDMSLEQRCEISASKRYNKDKEPELWQAWFDYYMNKLISEIIPASEIPSNFEGKHDGFGQYVRIRPMDVTEFKKMNGIPLEDEDDIKQT